MATLIKEALADAKAVPRSSSFTNGLFVCVCGPQSLVQSCTDAVRSCRAQDPHATIGLHVEQPEW